MTRSVAALMALFATPTPFTTAQSTLGAVLASRGDLDSFNEILDVSGISSGLFRNAGFNGTVFAPSDDAFNDFPVALFSSLLDSEWADHTSCFVRYHTVEGSYLASNLQDGTNLTSLDGDNLTVSGANPTRINEANIIEADFLASNGVAHIMDAVLMPACTSVNIFQQLNETEEFSTLASLIQRADLLDMVSTTAPITLFAPPNQAWDDMGDRFTQELSNPDNLPFLKAFLLNHIVPGNWYESRLESDMSFMLQTSLGTTAFFYNESETNFITNAQITQGNMLGSNGVIHTTDKVIILAAVADLLLNAKVVSDFISFSNFTAALTQADFFDALFLDSLNSPRTTTVFAPIDDAFANVPIEVMDKLLDPNWSFHLRELLRYHLVDGTLKSDELVHLDMLNTFSDFNLTITSGQNMLRVENATVLYRDLTAYNGVIQGIDVVLFPPSLTSSVIDQLRTNPLFSTFLGLLQASNNLTSLLEGGGPMTLFIPTNAAFELFDTTIDSSQLTPGDMETILEYHVAESNIFLNELPDGTFIPTLNGRNLTVSVLMSEDTEDVRSINDAQVLDGGLASNGVLYVLDQVLVPDLPTESPTASPAPTWDGYVAPSSAPSMADPSLPFQTDPTTQAPTSSSLRMSTRIVSWTVLPLCFLL